MANFMRFDNTAKCAFNNEPEQFANFQKLLTDAAKKNVQDYSKEEVKSKIIEKFRVALGIEPTDKPQQVKRAVRANRQLVYALIEETIDEMIHTGWTEGNKFFDQFVEYKNLALDDENEFYVEDDSILSVSKVSGNHHNIV